MQCNHNLNFLINTQQQNFSDITLRKTRKDTLSKTRNACGKCQCDGRWQSEVLGLEMVPLFGVA